jgi:hypothetical membrane protein
VPPVLLTGSWLIADALQPSSYSPVRQTVSVLAGQAGTDRWIMTAALFLIGACYLLAAIGLVPLSGPARLLLALGGLCSIGIALSPEPVTGPSPAHLAWTGIGATAMAIWPAFTGRRLPRGPRVLTVGSAAAATAVFLALLLWVVIETQGGAALGLAERLCSSAEAAWPFVVALALRRSPAAVAGDEWATAQVRASRLTAGVGRRPPGRGCCSGCAG